MKKAVVGFILLLCIIAGVQLTIYGQSQQNDKVTEVLADVGNETQSSVVEYYGVYQNDYLDMDGREAFLRQIAEEIGIRDPLQIVRSYDENREETKLIKAADKATTSLRFITLWQDGEEEPTQYLIINISMQATIEHALGYREKLAKILKDDTGNSRSSANVIGSYEGKLTLAERNQIADELLETLGARVVSEHRDMQLYTIYGYTSLIREYEMQENEAVNFNLAMHYNEQEDRTYIYAAVPILGLDF